MMKNEFELLAQCSLTPEEYERIETIYMHHPLMGPDSKAKAKIVEFYRAGLIPDLYPRAEEIQDRQRTIQDLGIKNRASEERATCKIELIRAEYAAESAAYEEAMRKLQEEVLVLQEARI